MCVVERYTILLKHKERGFFGFKVNKVEYHIYTLAFSILVHSFHSKRNNIKLDCSFKQLSKYSLMLIFYPLMLNVTYL